MIASLRGALLATLSNVESVGFKVAHTITPQHQEDRQMTVMFDELLSAGGDAI